VPVFQRTGGPVHNQEARLIPVRKRDLSDQFVRQVVVIVFNVEHRWKIPKKNAYRIWEIMSNDFVIPFLP
jgi:hypothetical protein